MNDYVLNMALEEGYKFGKKLIKIEGKKKTIEVAKNYIKSQELDLVIHF